MILLISWHLLKWQKDSWKYKMQLMMIILLQRKCLMVKKQNVYCYYDNLSHNNGTVVGPVKKWS